MNEEKDNSTNPMTPMTPMAQMTDDAIDHEIQAMLAVDPSPQFANRVKAHIARQPSPLIGFRWIWAAAAVAVAASIILMVVSETRTTGPVEMPPVATINETLPVLPAASASTAKSAEPQVSSKARLAPPDLLFSPAETAAIHRFMYGMPVAWPDLPLPTDVRTDDSTAPRMPDPIVVRAIDIAPIHIEPLTLPSVEEGVHQ